MKRFMRAWNVKADADAAREAAKEALEDELPWQYPKLRGRRSANSSKIR